MTCALNEPAIKFASAQLSAVLTFDILMFSTGNKPTLTVELDPNETVEAPKAAGFVLRSTNMYLAVSPALRARLDAASAGLSQMVITRADGFGPVGLGLDF